MTQRTLTGIVAIVALIAGIYGAIYIAPPEADENTVDYFQYYPAPKAIDEFTLTDANGDPFTRENLKNKWTLVFLGYTYCPDVCPTTLASLKKIWPVLSSKFEKSNIQVLFISVDPKRDTIQRLNSYISFFNKDFLAATGPHAEIFPLVRNLGLMYALSEDTEKEAYLVDHSASVVVVGPDVEVIGRFKPTMEPGKLAISDSEQILADMPKIVLSR